METKGLSEMKIGMEEYRSGMMKAHAVSNIPDRYHFVPILVSDEPSVSIIF